MNGLFLKIINRLLVSPVLARNFLSYHFNEAICDYTHVRRLLKQQHNIHQGKRCFLIGNGPSVQLDDLEKLSGEITFCCNRFHLCYEETSFIPTYIVSADDFMIKDFGLEISQSAIQHDQSSFFGMIQDPRRYLMEHESVYWLRLNRKRPFSPSLNILKSLGTGGATLLFAAQIALYMGIKDMYLYGVDHNFNYMTTNKFSRNLNTASGDSNHFIPNYRSGKNWVPPRTKFIEESIKGMHNYLTSINGSIINLSRSSKLPHIPKVKFNHVID